MSHDAELHVCVLDDDFARSLRLALWAEQMGTFTTTYTGWPSSAAFPLLAPLTYPSAEGVLGRLRPVEETGE